MGRGCLYPGSAEDGLDKTESREMCAFYLAFSFQGEAVWLLFHKLLGSPPGEPSKARGTERREQRGSRQTAWTRRNRMSPRSAAIFGA
jgi:hypothetical protein